MQKVEADKITHIPVTQQKLLLNFPVFSFLRQTGYVCLTQLITHIFYSVFDHLRLSHLSCLVL